MKVRRRLKTTAHLFVFVSMKDVMHRMWQCLKTVCRIIAVLSFFVV